MPTSSGKSRPPIAPGHFHPAHPYLHDEHPRDAPLDICPVLQCRHQKTCSKPYRGTFCRRLYLTYDEYANQLADKLERYSKQWAAEDKVKGIRPRKLSQGAALRELKQALQQRENEIFAEAEADWKAGKLDDQFGPYSPTGFYRPPPPLTYVEIIRDAKGNKIGEKTEADFRASTKPKGIGI